MYTITIANHKGGVGKTATAHALGEILAGRGLDVLLIDLDPQASLTQSCGIQPGEPSLADVLGGAQPGRAQLREVVRGIGPHLAIAPADISLAAAELGLTSRLGRENVLKKALASATGFDLCLVDCPPSLGLLTVAGLTAADAVLIPSQPQAVDLRGLRLFFDTLETLRNELNPDLEILGVLVTFYDRRLNHHQAALEAMHAAGLPVLAVMIGRSVRVAEAAGAGQSVASYEPGNPQAENYRQLADEVETWRKNRI